MITFTARKSSPKPCFAGLGEDYSARMIDHLEAKARSANIISDVHVQGVTLDNTWGDAVGLVFIAKNELISRWAAATVQKYMDAHPIPGHGYGCQRSRGSDVDVFAYTLDDGRTGISRRLPEDVHGTYRKFRAVPTYYFPGCD